MKSIAELNEARRQRVAKRRLEQQTRSQSGVAATVSEIKERRESFAERIRLAQERSRKSAQVDRAQRNSEYRGVDRVPERLRNLGDGQGEIVVEHTDANYRTRRISAQGKGRTMRPGMNQPAHNPERAARRRGKRRTSNR